ncbi:MAG: glycoside hydrolase family protein [Verrucomicrobia bacterium]|nr:glycoside hydrolase family protein [Verrucomicrobiota bacterium]MCH8526997.1 glycoside hydrolase family protein [Kiritimatiellia bacterium]
MNKAFADRLLAAPVDGGFRREGFWVWCGSVIKGEDDRYHMFASMWEKSVPFTPNWLTNSMIVHAVSRTPEGPYTYVEDVLPPRGNEYWDGMMTHNPTLHRHGNSYLLFYTGTTHRGGRPTDRISEALRLEARGNQRIGMAVASSPNGPWRRPDRPCLDVRPDHWDSYMTTNPAPCVMPGGEILLLYKSRTGMHSPLQYGAARAPSPGEPFERIGPDAPITFQDASIPYEDACLWIENDRFHMLFNDMTGLLTGEDHGGAHAVSADGIHWQLAPVPKAYSRNIRWTDGTVTTQGAFERPQLLIQDGVPTHLFAATADGPGGYSLADNTWNMAVPLRTHNERKK